MITPIPPVQSKQKRQTHLKKAMLEVLAKQHLLTASDILLALSELGLSVNKTSVYRNLDSFLADGIVCQQTFGDGEIRYELQHEHHDHLLCEKCGQISEVPCMVTAPTELAGYALHHHHLTLIGLCPNCRN